MWFCENKKKRPLRSSLIICAAATALFTWGFSARYLLRAEESVLAIDPSGSDEGYSAVLYNSENGLPTSEANAIEETEEGFIWIGSYSGLIRYDGNTFERLDSTGGIASVVSLFVDHRDRLWIGTNDSGAAVKEQNEVRMYSKADGLKSLSVRCITEDDHDNIYIGTARGIMLIQPDDTIVPLEDETLGEPYVRRMNKGADGLIYGVTQTGSVFALDGDRVVFCHDNDMLNLPHVRSVLPDSSNPGSVYLGTETSEIFYGRMDAEGFKTEQIIDVSPVNYVNDIKVYGDQMWISGDNGIGIWKNGVFRLMDSIPMNNSVEHMMSDYSGNLWFTSSRQGVMKIVPNQFADVFERFDLPDVVVNTTCLNNGKLMVGTDKGLTVLEKDRVLKTFPVNRVRTASGKEMEQNDLLELFDSCRIRSIQRDSHGTLWFSTYSPYGLVSYDGRDVTCYTSEDGMTSERIRTTFELQDGTILTACSGGGAAAIRNGKIAKIYGEEDGLPSADVLSITQAENGDLIFGTDGDGIYILKGSEVQHISTDNGLASDVVMRIRKDTKNDVFWIVTSNSIAYMNSSYQIVTIREFPYSNNFDLYENSHGNMWVLSSNGIYVTAVSDLLKNGRISPVFYGRDNGLPCIATANSYSELTEDGDLYIAGTSGVTKVNIERPFEDVTELKMAVPYVEADGVYIYPDVNGEFVIPADARKLMIYGFVYNYSLLNPQVTYYLEGFETEETTLRRSELVPVNYTNLKGGSYQFVMRIQDLFGGGSKELKVLIRKEKAIHERVWFQLMIMALGMGLIGLAVYLYIRRKTVIYERKAEENRIFIREMTEAFAKIIDMKDRYTNGHSMRVAQYTKMLAEELGYDKEKVEKYYNIALLHDIGKIGVPPEVLNKPGKLTDEEFSIIKSHSALGYNALKDISIMPDLAIGAGSHHERPDGKGYPRGLKGSDIPRVAQIIAVADTFDAMYSDRPYRKRMNYDKAVSIIREVAGTQLAQDVVDAFLRLHEQGKLRDANDDGGGTTEDIDNIHKRQNRKQKDRQSEPSENRA